MSIHQFSFPTPIFFGAGARHQIPEYLKKCGIKRPILITDKGIAALPLYSELKTALREAGLNVEGFSGIWGNPTESQVISGVAAFKKHEADAIIGLGGGAALDAAKAIAVMAKHPGHLFDYEDEAPGAHPIDEEIPFWIAVPTTSGTGSEVGRSAVISDDETHLKKIIFSPRLLAKAVFADPELTLELPSKITASTGMDALTHCVEAYLAKGYHPICDGIALEGIRLASKSLVRSVTHPTDLEARSDMMMSSMMGAIAFQKGLGLTHSCAHALSTVADLHHGLANGIMIDHALKHNRTAVPERFETMARMIGLEEPGADSFFEWLRQLKVKIGIPSKLSEVGIRSEQILALSAIATADGCHQNNPRPCTREDFVGIYNEAM